MNTASIRTTTLVVLVGLLLSASVGTALAQSAGTVADIDPTTSQSVGVSSPAPGEPRQENRSDRRTSTGAPPDPSHDVLGWENGVWHNESINVTVSDGLSRVESQRLLNRTMARVELLRQEEFDEPVELNFRTRSEYASLATAQPSGPATTALNVQYEALGFIGEDTNATAIQRQANAGFAAAFVVTRDVPQLDLQKGDVTVITTNGTAKYSGYILAHELVHTLQVQELGLADDRPAGNRDVRYGYNSLVEGEANFVTYQYLQQCGEEWSCVTADNRASADPSIGPVNAITTLKQVWYSNGAQFVAHRYRQGGWTAVEAAYESPPASTEQVIHPRKYGTDAPQSVTVPDRSNADWRPLTVRGRQVGYTIGEAGLFTMLWYPSAHNGERVVMPPSEILNRSQPAPHLLDYDHEASAGWDGDRLVPYVSETAGHNETAFVWRTVWDSASDAEQFAAAYRELLVYRGASQVANHQDTLRVPDDSPFGDAFWIHQNGSTVVIVNAPTVEDLSAVRAGAAPAVSADEETPATSEPADTAAETTVASEASNTTDSPTSETTGPGFGVALGIVALAIVAVGVNRLR